MLTDATGVKTHTEITGTGEPLPGGYHVVVQEVDESMVKVQGVVVEFAVQKGTVPGQEGKIHREVFWTNNKNFRDRMIRLALVLDLVRPGEKRDVRFADGVGRHCKIQVEETTSKKDGKTYRNIGDWGMAIWKMSDKEAEAIPVDDVALRATPGNAAASAAPAAPPTTAQQSAQPQAVQATIATTPQPVAAGAVRPAGWGDL